MKRSHQVIIMFVLMLAWCAALIADTSAVLPPKRTSATPIPGPDALLPSKKAEQARALRAAAEALEDSARRDLTDLWVSIQNKQLAVDFSTVKFHVKTIGVDFQEVGTNFIMQVTLSYKEKY